jgi:hypothetical protein
MRTTLNFDRVNRLALPQLSSLCRQWLPDGRIIGSEYVARNPTRIDRNAGSFKINTNTGKWCDFATGDTGGDVVSLFAYLTGARQIDAAHKLLEILEIRHG